jgi:hypothetical protein
VDQILGWRFYSPSIANVYRVVVQFGRILSRPPETYFLPLLTGGSILPRRTPSHLPLDFGLGTDADQPAAATWPCRPTSDFRLHWSSRESACDELKCARDCTAMVGKRLFTSCQEGPTNAYCKRLLSPTLTRRSDSWAEWLPRLGWDACALAAPIAHDTAKPGRSRRVRAQKCKAAQFAPKKGGVLRLTRRLAAVVLWKSEPQQVPEAPTPARGERGIH